MRRPLLISVLIYAAFTLSIGQAVVTRPSGGIAADRGDPVLNAGILAWNARHLPWTEAWYQFPGFHPATDALVFSEHLLGLSVVATPLYWLTGSAVAAYNLTLLATYVLCGMAMYALVWRLTGHAAASFLAGFAYAFAPYKMSQIGHLQAMASFWAPLSLLGLHAFLAARAGGPSRVRPHWWLALFAAAWLMQGAANLYFLVFFSVVIGLWVAWFVIGRGRWRDLAWIAAATLVALLPQAPILLRYAESHARYQLARAAAETVGFSADISDVACAVPRLPMWGWLAGGRCGNEQELFPGATLLVLLAAAGAAAWHLRWPSSHARRVATLASGLALILGTAMLGSALGVALDGPWAWNVAGIEVTSSSVSEPFTRGVLLLVAGAILAPALWTAVRSASIPAFYLLAAAVTWMLAWGPAPALYGQPALAQGPYAWLMLLPGVDGLRVPARFWMMALLCLCIAMGVLLAAALRGRSARVALLTAAVGTVGLAADGWAPLPSAPLIATAPRPDLLSGGVTLTLPLGADYEVDAGAQLEAIEGRWRSVNGYSGYEPPHYALLRDASQVAGPLLVDALARERDLDVVVDEDALDLVALVEAQPGVRLAGARRGLRQYRIPRRGGPPAPGEPGAMRHAITGVSASCSAQLATLVLDGNQETRWECGAQRPGQDITADLGRVTTVGSVVTAAGRFTTDYPRDLVVETSPDGVVWALARAGGVQLETFDAIAAAPGDLRIVLSLEPRPARFVRLRLRSRDETFYWSVTELEVWSGP